VPQPDPAAPTWWIAASAWPTHPAGREFRRHTRGPGTHLSTPFLPGHDGQQRPKKRLEMVKRAPPEIIISDIGLPGISGIEFMVQVRKHPEWRDVVAIALSGLGREKDIKGAQSSRPSTRIC